MTNDPPWTQRQANSGSLQVSLPFGSAGDQGVFFWNLRQPSPYDGSVTIDARNYTSLAFDIHFAPGTPLNAAGILAPLHVDLPGSENGGDFSLFPA